MNSNEAVRVLIVEDDFMVREMIRGRVEEMGHTVIGEALDGRQAVEMTQSLQPGVVLMDIGMSDMDGIEATQCIYDACPTPVVMLTAYDTPALVERAGLAGAGAYLVKLPTAREIERAIIIAIARFDDMMELRRLNGELQTRNQELQTRNEQLQSALNKVKLLSGLLPICANCKKVRDDEGYWQEVEVYIRDHSEAQFSHGICPDCVQVLYPELQQELDERKQIVLTALTKLRWASLEDIAAATDLPKDDTSTYLEIMVRDGQIRYVEIEGENFYTLANVR